MPKAVIFTIDKCLADVRGTVKYPVFTDQPVPGIKQAIENLQKEDTQIIVAATHSGPAWRWWTLQDSAYTKFPGIETVCKRFFTLSDALDLHNASWWIATGDKKIYEKIGAKLDPSASAEEQVKALDPLREIDQEFITRFQDHGINEVIARHNGTWRFPESALLTTALLYYHIQQEEAIMVLSPGGIEEQAAKNGEIPYMYTKRFLEKYG